MLFAVCVFTLFNLSCFEDFNMNKVVSKCVTDCSNTFHVEFKCEQKGPLFCENISLWPIFQPKNRAFFIYNKYLKYNQT